MSFDTHQEAASTLTDLGIVAFLALAGLAAVTLLRRNYGHNVDYGAE